jgi:hypothetical protein
LIDEAGPEAGGRHLMIDRGERDVESYRFTGGRSPIADHVTA